MFKKFICLTLFFLLSANVFGAGTLKTPDNVQTVNVANVTTLTATTGTITTLGGAMDANNENITNIDVDSGLLMGLQLGLLVLQLVYFQH